MIQDNRDNRREGAYRFAPRHLRELDSYSFVPLRINEHFKRFFEETILPTLTISGYKLEEKRRTAMQCAYHAIKTRRSNRVTADKRCTEDAATRKRAALWDALIEAGWVRKCLGSQSSQRVTRYEATEKLMKARDNWPLEMFDQHKMPKPLDLIIFREEKANGSHVDVPFDHALRVHMEKRGKSESDIEKAMQKASRVRASINAVNAVNSSHAFQATNDQGAVFQPVINLTQMHIGRIGRGVRFYTRGFDSVQSLDKHTRSRMRIDRQHVAEIDFSCSLLRIIHAVLKIRTLPGDLYRAEEIIGSPWKYMNMQERKQLRSFIKQATLICFNTTHTKAVRAVSFAYNQMDARKKREWPLKELPKPSDLLDAIADVQEHLSDYLFNPVRGMKIITLESKIMFRIVKEIVLKANKPAIPIHDALIVRVRDMDLAKHVMQKVYFDTLGVDPVISAQKHCKH